MALLGPGCADRAHPEDAAVAYQNGVANAQAGRTVAALDNLETALGLDDTNVPAHVLYAVLHERRGDLDTAERHLRRAQEIHPEDPDPALHLARILRKRKLDEQIDTARQAIVDSGPDPERLIAFGDLLRERERFDDAQIHYLWAQRSGPPNAAIQAGLGLIYSHQHREVRALYHLSEALRMDSAMSEARDELAWILATSSHADLRDAAEAARIAEAALARGTRVSTRMLDALAAAYAGTGRFEEARQAADAAIASARAAGDHVYAHRLADRLRLYEAGRDFVGPPVDAS